MEILTAEDRKTFRYEARSVRQEAWAVQLVQFAFDHPGKYTDSISTSVYGSSNYHDEMGLGVAWIAKATGDPADLARAKQVEIHQHHQHHHHHAGVRGVRWEPRLQQRLDQLGRQDPGLRGRDVRADR